MHLSELQSLLRTADSFTAIEHLQRHGTPAEIAARYEALLSDLYWKAHDLPAAITIGRAGILYCLTQSLAPGTAPHSAHHLRSIAKGLAYDLGSFTWPGWEEPGINPMPADLAVGRDCAQLNLRLALELKRSPERLSMSHWLIGAHALAARDFAQAEQSFRQAQEVLPVTDPAAQSMHPCNHGYLAIAQLCQNPADAAAEKRLAEIMTHLGARADDDAKTYLPQLQSARRLFVPTST